MSELRVLLALCLAAGCGFKTPAGVSGDGGARDAGPEAGAPDPEAGPDDAPLDGPIIGNTCLTKWMNHTVQLTAPVNLTGFNSTDVDRDPYMSRDGTELYFSSTRAGMGDVFVAKRPAASGPFGNPMPAGGLNSNKADDKIALTADGLTAVIASARTAGAGLTDLYLATRTSAAAMFMNVDRTAFGTIDDANEQQDPDISGDGMRVYFSVGSPQRIVMVSRGTTSDVFAGQTDVIDSGFGDADPSWAQNERLILFSSERPSGQGGPALTNIWYGTRANTTDTLADITVTLAPAINTDDTDGDPVLSPDGCTLYFSSDRTGVHDLYMSTVIP